MIHDTVFWPFYGTVIKCKYYVISDHARIGLSMLWLNYHFPSSPHLGCEWPVELISLYFHRVITPTRPSLSPSFITHTPSSPLSTTFLPSGKQSPVTGSHLVISTRHCYKASHLSISLLHGSPLVSSIVSFMGLNCYVKDFCGFTSRNK